MLGVIFLVIILTYFHVTVWDSLIGSKLDARRYYEAHLYVYILAIAKIN